ncbi:hypothetical protein E1A91_A12G076000v1 [Gossypium mustelinum]|uniref:Uncharacterized protein n=1 Tax=Gossypium mustelinum TaxID=34275 RepID=A0A5D2WRK4_GOSMU|nr:hypothetical protein E1A91_A12G076000v1 [Gossypium mustelinum]
MAVEICLSQLPLLVEDRNAEFQGSMDLFKGMVMGAAASTEKYLCRSGVSQSRSSAGIKLTSNCSLLVVEVSYSEHHVVYSVEVSKILLFRRKCIVVIRLGFQRLIMNILIK